MAAFGWAPANEVSSDLSGARIGQYLQRGRWRMGLGLVVLAAGVLTIAAPWLMHIPALAGPLAALGCLPPPTR